MATRHTNQELQSPSRSDPDSPGCFPATVEHFANTSPRSNAEATSRGVSDEDDFPADLKNRQILLITESLGPVNGVSRTTLSLITYLRDHGVDLAVVAPHYYHSKQAGTRRTDNAGVGVGIGVQLQSQPQPQPQPQPRELRLPGYPLPYNPDLTVVYPFNINDIFNGTFPHSYPDLIYLASPASAGFQFLLQIRQLQLPHAPVVLVNFQTDLSAYSEVLFPAPIARFAVWLLRATQGHLFSHHCVKTIFYPSSSIRRYLEKDAGISPKKLVHLGRGVDTVLFDPCRRDHGYRSALAPNDETILVAVCRLAAEKGFDFLARVAIRLAQTKVPFKLLVVGGNTNPAVEADIRRLFEPVRDRVVFTGFLTGLELARAYASGDIFLHCSTTETFGLVVLEAMASGVPVVARDQGGPSDIIRDGETGYLVAPGDLDRFVALVRRLSIDDSLRSAMAAASRTFACQNTWERINRKVAWQMAESMEKQHSPPFGTSYSDGTLAAKQGQMSRIVTLVETAAPLEHPWGNPILDRFKFSSSEIQIQQSLQRIKDEGDKDKDEDEDALTQELIETAVPLEHRWGNPIPDRFKFSSSEIQIQQSL